MGHEGRGRRWLGVRQRARRVRGGRRILGGHGRLGRVALGGLELLQLDLLLADHVKQTVHLGLLLGLELLVQLAEAGGAAAVLGVAARQERRGRQGRRAGRAVARGSRRGSVVKHLAGRRYGGVVQVKVVEDGGSATAVGLGRRRQSVARERAT